VGVEADHLVAEPHVDGGEPLHAGAQRSLQAGLVEHVARLPAVALRPVCRREAEEHVALGGHEVHAQHRRGVGEHGLGQPDALEHPHDLVVEVGGAREVVHVEGRLDDDDVEPGLTEQVGQHRPDGAVADDDDVVDRGHHVTAPGRGPAPRCR
jgi:hypothetical protein